MSILLLCGVFSSLYYILLNIIVPLQDPEYDITSHTISELSAIGAPTRALWVTLCIVYSLFLIAFAVGIWRIAVNHPSLRIVAVLIFFYGFSGFFWPPMHQRAVIAAGGDTLTDTMHLVFAGFTVLLMLWIMFFGAKASGRKFRIYTAISIAVLIFFGMLTGIQSPNIDKGLPTPLIGVWERINIGVFMVWMIVFGLTLLREAIHFPKKDTGKGLSKIKI